MYDPSGLYIDPILTNFSVGFRDLALSSERLMPNTPVRTKSGQYRVFDRSNNLIFESRREPGTVAHEILGAKWSQDVFTTREHSLQSPVLDEERQQLTSQGGLANPTFGGDLQLNPERDAADLVMRSLLLAHEQAVSVMLRNAANYPGGNTVTLTGTQQWDDYTNGVTSVSNPVNDIVIGMRAVYNATGRWPNTLAVPALGMRYIENHPRIVDRFKTFALTMDGAFQALTGFTGTIIPLESMYNAANNIDAAQSMTSFWGKDVWLGLVDEAPGLNQMTFGKTFSQIYPDGSIRPTERWREEPRKADLVRTSWSYDLKIVTASAGYLIKTAFGAAAF